MIRARTVIAEAIQHGTEENLIDAGLADALASAVMEDLAEEGFVIVSVTRVPDWASVYATMLLAAKEEP